MSLTPFVDLSGRPDGEKQEQLRTGDSEQADGLSKQSNSNTEWQQQKTTAVAEWEAHASCSDAITSFSLPCSPSMNGGGAKQHT